MAGVNYFLCLRKTPGEKTEGTHAPKLLEETFLGTEHSQ